MTIPEAVRLVLQAGSLGSRGEVFVLDMGHLVKITDLAMNLIRLSGLVPERDVKIEFVGLRPGEKLEEELLTSQEAGMRLTRYPKIFVIEPEPQDWSFLPEALWQLEQAALDDDAAAVRAILDTMNIGYLGRQELIAASMPGRARVG